MEKDVRNGVEGVGKGIKGKKEKRDGKRSEWLIPCIEKLSAYW